MAIKHGIDVKSVRKAHGLTQQAMAEEIGVDRKTIQRWELEGRKPSPLARRQLQRYLRPKDGDSGVQRRPLQEPTETPLPIDKPRGVIPGL